MTVDGRLQSCEREGNSLKILISLAPRQTAEIRVVAVGADRIDSPARKTVVHNLAVAGRRLLCEFRDNYLDTNPVLRNFLPSVK